MSDKKIAGFRDMSTAPLDGTIVLVVETPNGEHFNVVPAMYMNSGGGDPRLGQKPIGKISWWGVCGSRYTGEGGGECDLPVRWKPLAITPLGWQPMPRLPRPKKCRQLLDVWSNVVERAEALAKAAKEQQA